MRKNYGKLFALSASLLLATASAALAAGSHDAPAKPNPGEVLQNAISGNSEYVSTHNDSYFEAYQKGQTPGMVVLGCADSRVHTNLFGIDPNNNLFFIRNIGNQMANGEGSVDYGVRHLPTSVLLVLGHSGCGAVKAAMGDYSKETEGIKHELDPLKDVLTADDGQGEFDARWSKNIERNVDYQVSYAKKLYADKVNSGQLTVVGAVYDFTDSYGKGKGSMVITNINGETDAAKLKEHPVMKNFPKSASLAKLGDKAGATSYEPSIGYGYSAPKMAAPKK